MKLTIERDQSGLVFVTSPDVYGLHVAEPTLSAALAVVPGLLRALAEAGCSQAAKAVEDLGMKED